MDAAGTRASGVLGGYMIATGVISAFGAATQFAVMALLGIPLALPLAVLSFFGGFIPYIGSFITTGIAFLVTVAVGTPTDIAVMAIFTIVFNIVQGNFVAPLVYGRAVSIHPAVVLIAIPAGSRSPGSSACSSSFRRSASWSRRGGRCCWSSATSLPILKTVRWLTTRRASPLVRHRRSITRAGHRRRRRHESNGRASLTAMCRRPDVRVDSVC